MNLFSVLYPKYVCNDRDNIETRFHRVQYQDVPPTQSIVKSSEFVVIRGSWARIGIEMAWRLHVSRTYVSCVMQAKQ